MFLAIVVFLLTIGVSIFILYPLLTPQQSRDDSNTEAEELMLTRDQLFADIRELDFDHRMEKLTDADYNELLDQMKDEAATVIESLDALDADTSASQSHAEPTDADIEARIAAMRADMASDKDEDEISCTSCGSQNQADARFCNSCGASMTEDEKE
jgi:hypothetical protein